MDFDTLKQNILASKYTTYEEFFLDLQLIWDNCKHYNMAGSDICKLSERMEKMTRRELHKFKSAHGLSGLTLPNSGATRAAAPARASKRSGNQKNNTKEDKDMDGGDDLRDSGEQDSNEVTRDMKLEFVSKIKKMSNAGLTSLVEKIKEVKSQTITELPQEKIQIKVDDFDKVEFTKLSEHVDNILMQELPSKRQKTH